MNNTIVSKRRLALPIQLTHGCDPELFASHSSGKVRPRQAIVASERIIPAEGLKSAMNYGTVERDGVQIELHPRQSTCRQSMSAQLADVLMTLNRHLTKHNEDNKTNYVLDFRQVVTLTKGDLAKMSPDARVLGCTPSENAYGHPFIEVDGNTYPIRSAAGHMHMGTDILNTGVEAVNLVRLLDVIVGNTCVLLDRNPLAAKRRKTYGRAGEYRLPAHGLEYRTLSNFWLRSYVLTSMVFGLGAVAHNVALAHRPVPSYFRDMWGASAQFADAAQFLMERVDLQRIEKAINENDWELARDNYERIRPFFEQLEMDGNRGIDWHIVGDFDYFVDQVRRAELDGNPDPLSVWFPDDPLTHWSNASNRHHGFERFMVHAVRTRKPSTFTGLMWVDETKQAPPIEQPDVVAIPDITVPAITSTAEATSING